MRLRHKKNAEVDVLTNPFVINTESGVIDIGANFANPNLPLHLELGMGKGSFITKLSQQNPDINYIGIEKSATITLKAIENALASKNNETIPNLRFMCVNIENLSNIFTPHSIDKIYLNFSDPWPKKRHESRRLTHQKFLSIYEKLLKPNSLIEFKTDNLSLFDFSLEQIKNSNFSLLEFTYDLHSDERMNEGNIMTEYEEKFSRFGNKICKLIARSH